MWSQWYRSHWPTLPPELRSEGGEAVTEARFLEIAGQIARLAEIGPDDQVLDLGCSIGAITYALSLRCGRVVGVDFVEDSLSYAREHHSAPNVEYVACDLAEYPIGDDVDCIVLNNVIHMLDTAAIARRLLRRCYEGLRPSGRLYLGEVPDTRKLWRYATEGRKGPRAFAHELLPGWAFPLLSRLRGRPLGRILWFNRRRLARIVGCPVERVSVHDEPGTVLNALERSHFVIRKPDR